MAQRSIMDVADAARRADVPGEKASVGVRDGRALTPASTPRNARY
jgi:hypothetical protein